MSRSFVVTGAGRTLVERLLGEDYSVVVIDLL